MSRSLCRLISVLLLAGALACRTDPDASPSPPPAASASIEQTAVPHTPRKVDRIAKAMGTEVRFIAYTTETLNEEALSAAIQRALDEIERLERLMTSWSDDSEVAEINRRAGEFVKVSAETFEVVDKSLWVSRLSEGTFDVTFETMSDLWKFGDAAEDPPRVPSPKQVDARRRAIDFRKIRLDPEARAVATGAGQRLGLGGIAKGYIVDAAARVLKSAGATSFLAQAGGDLYGEGRKPDGTPWVSGIQDPRGARGEFFAVLELENRAFSTAGDYARSFVVGKKRYHHIIDPRTGYPATACRSVTVWAEDALTADAIDDAVFILGVKKGLSLIESLPGVGAVIVDDENKVHVSKRLEGKVRMLRPPTDGI